MKTRSLILPLLATAPWLVALRSRCRRPPRSRGARGRRASRRTVRRTPPQAAIAATPKPPPPLAKKPVVTVPTGPPPTKLVTKDLVQGTGQTVKEGNTVTVNYVGELYKSGKEFDSSWSRNQPATFPLTAGSVIEGWVQGIPGMKVGGRRELIIPPSLGYGSKRAVGTTIPPNSTLVFVVDLLSTSS